MFCFYVFFFYFVSFCFLFFFFCFFLLFFFFFFFFSSRRRHTRYIGDWSSDVCSSDLVARGDFAKDAPSRHGPLPWRPALMDGARGQLASECLAQLLPEFLDRKSVV